MVDTIVPFKISSQTGFACLVLKLDLETGRGCYVKSHARCSNAGSWCWLVVGTSSGTITGHMPYSHKARNSTQYELLRTVRLLTWSRVQGRKIKARLLLNGYHWKLTALLLQFTTRVRRSSLSSRKGQADLGVEGASGHVVAMQSVKIYLFVLSRSKEEKLDKKKLPWLSKCWGLHWSLDFILRLIYGPPWGFTQGIRSCYTLPGFPLQSCWKNQLPQVLANFRPTWHKLQSFWKMKPLVTKCSH